MVEKIFYNSSPVAERSSTFCGATFARRQLGRFIHCEWMYSTRMYACQVHRSIFLRLAPSAGVKRFVLLRLDPRLDSRRLFIQAGETPINPIRIPNATLENRLFPT